MNNETDWLDILLIAAQGLAFLIFAACVIFIKRQRMKKRVEDSDG